MATYLYCVAHGARPTLGGRASAGLPGMARARVLDAGRSLWLIVATAPLSRYSGPAIERGLRDLEWVSRCAVAHEAVVEHVAERRTVIPVKLFTLFASDARAVAYVARVRATLDRAVKRVAGCREWGVRIGLDETRALRRARAETTVEANEGDAGTRFLRLKKQLRDDSRELASRARAEVDDAFDELLRHARDARRRPPVHGAVGIRMLLDAAFLVPATGAARFTRAVNAVARRLADRGYDVTLTGPWPPYNFVGDAA